MAKKITKKHREEKWKQAIDVLNDSVILKLAPSDVHGIGLFAMRDIKKDTNLYTDAIPRAFDLPYKKFSKLRPDVREELVSHWPRISEDKAFLYPDCKRSSYINHSDNPNYDLDTDQAIKDIKAGEEILADYKKIPNYKKVYTFIK